MAGILSLAGGLIRRFGVGAAGPFGGGLVRVIRAAGSDCSARFPRGVKLRHACPVRLCRGAGQTRYARQLPVETGAGCLCWCQAWSQGPSDTPSDDVLGVFLGVFLKIKFQDARFYAVFGR